MVAPGRALAVAVALLWAAGAPAQPAAAAPAVAVPTHSLEDLLALARRDNLALAAARAQALAARAGVTTARAHPNPEFEVLGGSLRARVPGVTGGGTTSLVFSQRIENPRLRESRREAATAGAQSAEIGVWVVENDLMALVKTRFFETLRREEELDAAREDLALTEQIRDRIRVRTRTGEAARFDLIRAENEVAIAAKQVEMGIARVAESRALLRQAVGSSLPERFALSGDFYRKTPQADYGALRDAVLAANPELKRALADLARAQKQVEVETAQVLPAVTVRIAQDNEPEVRGTRAGVALAVPLWDRRRGPIDEARALAIRSRTESDLRRHLLAQAFEAGWQQYQASLKAVQALEGGILQQARTVVDIAEAAYRFGERGILEYLDARRQFRVVRADLIATRFELHAAKAELERLAASDIKGE
ncbi:MAG: TolC family protein [Burkholderiales bacterium]|nr:TolC family protein [Burkholderiales bacterium]